MNKKAVVTLVIVTILALLITGCDGAIGAQGGGPGGNQNGAGKEVDTLGEGGVEPKLDITPGAQPGLGGGEGDENAINSQGTVVPPPEGQPNGEGIVTIGGSSSSGGDTEPISADWINWPLYTDKSYGFSVRYPEAYIVLPEADSASYNGLTPLKTVHFQDKQIANSETADLEPPKFSVEVFAGTGDVSLQDWVGKYGFAPGRATVETVQFSGAKEAVRVTLSTLLAPNVFYYISAGQYVYRVVPLGSYSESMLASMKIE